MGDYFTLVSCGSCTALLALPVKTEASLSSTSVKNCAYRGSIASHFCICSWVHIDGTMSLSYDLSFVKGLITGPVYVYCLGIMRQQLR